MAIEQLFDILDDWGLTTLGEACQRSGGNIQTGPFGSQLHASDYVSVGIPSIMPQNLSSDRISTNEISRITFEDAERLSRYLVQTGDIVYSRRGDVERRALVTETENGWLCGTGCLRIRFGEKTINPVYAYYYLGHPNVREWIVRHAIGATLPNLNTSILSVLPFVLPPLSEQQAIADIPGSLDNKIELNRRTNATLEETARALFKSWFVDFDPVRAKMEGRQPDGMDAETAALFPDRLVESELGPIPEGWNVCRLGEVIELAYGKPLKAETRREGTIPVYGSNGQVGWHNIKMVDGPGIIVGRKGNPGTVNWEHSDFFPIDTTFYVVPKTKISLLYLYFLLELQRLPFLSADSAVPGLNRNAAYMNYALVPSSETLEIFDSIVSRIMNQIDSYNTLSRTLAETRDALLPKLLSGEVRVENINVRVNNHD